MKLIEVHRAILGVLWSLVFVALPRVCDCQVRVAHFETVESEELHIERVRRTWHFLSPGTINIVEENTTEPPLLVLSIDSNFLVVHGDGVAEVEDIVWRGDGCEEVPLSVINVDGAAGPLRAAEPAIGTDSKVSRRNRHSALDVAKVLHRRVGVHQLYRLRPPAADARARIAAVGVEAGALGAVPGGAAGGARTAIGGRHRGGHGREARRPVGGARRAALVEARGAEVGGGLCADGHDWGRGGALVTCGLGRRPPAWLGGFGRCRRGGRAGTGAAERLCLAPQREEVGARLGAAGNLHRERPGEGAGRGRRTRAAIRAGRRSPRPRPFFPHPGGGEHREDPFSCLRFLSVLVRVDSAPRTNQWGLDLDCGRECRRMKGAQVRGGVPPAEEGDGMGAESAGEDDEIDLRPSESQRLRSNLVGEESSSPLRSPAELVAESECERCITAGVRGLWNTRVEGPFRRLR
eukprot:scaffold46203_cov25-Tisochrysis_lutea.AAC.1